MKIEVINNQRVFTPDNGLWLLNANDRVISNKVYLGVNADSSQWQEITEEEKQSIESTWLLDEEATEADYVAALEKLGVYAYA